MKACLEYYCLGAMPGLYQPNFEQPKSFFERNEAVAPIMK